ncbi:Hypothetical predicted protein [Olea europaea subsp. europaea]|uniref:AT-hook motif nuclear-localized protein n=1 Tax=Olea europaea subsp. europaea TaxID=158383 RepID=A0A8S0UH22_OLEEU|nr:Hypothetical predicted protein [Olea europaea subsp. europaea]
MEDKESTESGSPGGKSESESPPITSGGDTVGVAATGGDTVSCGGGVALQAMNVSIERSVGVINAPAITVGGILGVSGGSGSGGGGGKKRGRPRKYDSDGNLRVPLVGSPPGGVILPPAPTGRRRPGLFFFLDLVLSIRAGELFTTTAGGDFTPHMITVYTGEDVAGKIITFAQKGPRGICVLSANGSVSNVTIRQPGSSGGILTYEGRFEILTLTGSFTYSENGGIKSRTGGLSVSLAGPDGRVIGGGIAGMLMAASPIQVVFGSFMPNCYKTPKRKHNLEPRVAPLVLSPPAPMTVATPISQAAPEINISPVPPSQFPVPNQQETDNDTTKKGYPYSTSKVTADWNGTEPISNQRPSPDINISVSVE